LKSSDFTSITPHPSVLYQDKVYHSNVDNITCHDIMTGDKKWETNLPAQGDYFQSSGILVDKDRIYANSDAGQLFCLNAVNGIINWQIRSSGSSTPLSILNGIIYFVGGGDGKLHAVDAETGAYLWKIDSPDKGKNKWAVFSGMCAVVPGVGLEKGKIVVTTGLNAYCYEAIK
jgi:outer membrane protein assembly factor BamB